MKKLYSILTDISLFKVLFMIFALAYTLPIINVYAAFVIKITMIWGFLLLCIYFHRGQIKFNNIFTILFLLFALISIIFNYSDGFSRNMKDFLYLVLEVLVLTVCVSKNETEHLIWINHVLIAFMALGFTLSLLIFCQQLNYVPGLPDDYIIGFIDGRLWGWCGNPNTLAYMSIFGMFAMYFNYPYVKRRRVVTYLYGFITLEALACLILSASRSGLVGFFLIVFVLLLRPLTLSKENVWKRGLRACILCVALMLGMKVYEAGLKMIPDSLNFIHTNAESNVRDEKREIGSDYSNGRFIIWKGGLSLSKEHFLFGVGQDALSRKVNPYMPKDYVKKAPHITKNMHNVFLQVLTTMGVFAFISFVLMFLQTFLSHRKEIRMHRNTMLLSLFCAVILIMNLFDSNIISFMNLFICVVFWIYFGCFMSSAITGDERKRIVFCINSLGIGGAEKVLCDVVNHMDHAKYNVSILTLFHEGELLSMVDSAVDMRTIIKKPTHIKKALLWRCVKYLPLTLLQYLNCKNGDVYIAFMEGMPTKLIGSMRNKKRKFCWIHTDIAHNTVSETNFRNQRQALNCYRNMNQIICVSQDCRNRFLEVYPSLHDICSVIYNCLDINHIRMQAEEEVVLPFTRQRDDILLCSVGRLVEEKGFDRLLRVVEKLIKENTHYKLMLIGDGPQRAMLDELIKELSLQEYVFLIGYQKNPYAFMKHADCFVCSSYVEGFSLVVAEAMVIGCSMISTDCTGPSELLHNHCGTICDNSQEGLYHALYNLAHESPVRDEEAVQKRLQKFNIEHIISDITNLIEGDEHV